MNMTLRGLSSRFGLVGLVNVTQAAPVTAPLQLDRAFDRDTYNPADDVMPEAVAALQAKSDAYRGDGEWVFPEDDEQSGEAVPAA
ncbi:hypothetical protein Q8W71_02155 [Methylobacterium sp. NEAU 140]|uniref:hypothetical protein n=1 Tax=Methylobacterium sp. NEAU 140 TaxID=3064945 RepID=UPI002732E8D7|nr:hypothetical protein [Methylobacterium sp. NEAU 140]MDP4021411.1 hypothetical protein [Methylobacterium sp. NEAU 140]